MLFNVLLLSFCFDLSLSAKILGVFPTPYVSHQKVFQPIWRELALRGHQVTVISPMVLNENIPNLTEIDVGPKLQEFFKSVDMQKILHKENFMIQSTYNLFEMGSNMIDRFLGYEELKPFVTGEGKAFDLIIIEAITTAPHAFGYVYNAPVIGICSFGGSFNLHDSVGNPTHPIISPDANLNIVGEPTFSNRLSSVTYNILFRLMYEWFFMPVFDKSIRKYFGDGMPYLGDLERNVSLLLLNVNPLMHMIRPNVPAIVELSQMHIKPKNPLPRDIKEFLDASREGVIYFSLGSNIISCNLSETVRRTITQALRELPYKVLWKFEDNVLRGKPKNVVIKKWLPQQDVLGHPNVKAFVTQGGIQSIEEAIVNEVPMVGIPFFGDQPLNVMRLVDKKVAKYVDFLKMTKDDLKNAILEVAQNPKYKENVKTLKSLLTDQPMTGLNKAIWWIEYVIRHKGARHLRSAAIDMPYWKYFFLDVIAVYLVGTLIFLYLLWKFVNLIGFILFSENNGIKVKVN